MPDRLFDALAARQRRLLVGMIERARSGGDEPLALDGDRIERTPDLSRVELYHVHLPKLSDAGVVRWDRETGEIAAGPRFDDACRLLRATCDDRDGVPAD